jgi:hypothetical protein
MKKVISVFLTAMIICCGVSGTANAQSLDKDNTSTRSVFRNGYQRLGFNYLGNKLDAAMSPKANVFNGNFGASTGYCLEFGRNFYFNKSSASKVRFGLDWTYISLTYNKMNWNDYAKNTANNTVYLDGTSIAASVSGRLGPVVSFNPVEKLVIDVRYQLAPSLYFFDQSFYKNEGQANEQYFEFMDNRRSNVDNTYDAESIKNRLSFGVKSAFGITLRRQGIGFSFDYMPGNVKINYDSNEGHGQDKIKATNTQLKLSFQL